MPSLLRYLVVFFLCALPAVGQAAKLKQELKAKETAAKKDPEALFEVGKWATEKSLLDDAKRIYQAVVKIKSDHAGANEALGNQLIEGKWMPAKEAEALRKKLLVAEFTAKGMVEVAGVWVEKDKVDDAKRGIFHHEKETVTKEELLQFQAGKVRHPDTGEFIDAKHLEKATTHYYPISNSRWVDQKEADAFHSDLKRPWIVRTGKGMILSTLPFAKIEELQIYLDQGLDTIAPLFAHKQLAPAHRPVVVIAATEAEYRELGTAYGEGTDAAGCFLIGDEAQPIQIPFLGDVRAAICYNEKSWGIRYIRHAAALSYLHGLSAEAGVDLPPWFVHGVASMTSRFQTDSDAGWFGKQHVAKGGVRNVKGFFAGFAISGDMESTAIDYNMFQAGLLVSYAAHGGDAKVTEALQGVTGLLTGAQKGNAEKALTKLQGLLTDAEPKIATHLQNLIAKAPQ